ncbi:porin Gram-negative type [Marinomonas posidonica IVIA-Po-181]|uniref:Porin Gram-negative type n=2 Tax=Marinomonas TaxID=28253 RepID=F6D117_MARPP|nr:porin Gram-negative type [Marinomonas posidonica IVIA-Po-181]
MQLMCVLLLISGECLDCFRVACKYQAPTRNYVHIKGKTRMKKSIIAIAVSSAALASVSVHAAEGSTVDVYGNIQYAYTDTDDGSEFADNGSTFGFKGETLINDDLTAFFKYELEADADEKNGDVSVGLDQAFVGLKGGFGKVQVGTFDSIYNNAIQDSVDQFENLGFTSNPLTTEGDTIAYFSPSMNGFEVQLSAQVKGDAEEAETVEINETDFTIEDGTAVTAVIKYSTDALTLAVGYDGLDNVDVDINGTYGLSVGYQATSNLNLTAKFESTDDLQDTVGLAARYGYGAGDLYASVQSISPETGDDFNEYGAGVTYSLASNVYVYGEVGSFENASNSDTDTQTAVGVYYGF